MCASLGFSHREGRSVHRESTKRRPSAWLGFGFALGATVIWSTNFILARGLSDSVPPATIAFLRWAIATVVLVPTSALPVWRERRAIRQHLKYLIATAFTGMTVFHALLYLAAHFTSALNLSLIAISSPLFTLLFARLFLGEVLNTGRAAGVVLAAAGVAVLVTRGDLGLLLRLHLSIGDLWMALAAVTFSLYTVLVRMKPRDIGQASFLLTTFGFGTFMLIPWTAWEMFHYAPPVFSPAVLGSILFMGLGPSLVSYYLWTLAVASIGPSRSGFVYYSLPLFSGLEAFFFLGESISPVHAVSGLLIFCGIILAARS